MSVLIRGMIEDHIDEGEEIPLPNVHSTTLSKACWRSFGDFHTPAPSSTTQAVRNVVQPYQNGLKLDYVKASAWSAHATVRSEA